MSQVATTRVQSPSIVVGAMLRLLALPLVAIVAVGIAIATGLPANRVPLLAATLVLMSVLLGFVAVDRLRPREQRNLLLMIFSCAYLVMFVIPVFVFYLGDRGYMPEFIPNPVALTPQTVTFGVIAATIGYLALLAGNLLPVGRGFARFVPQMRREWSAETTLVVALLIIPMGWVVRLVSEFGWLPERAGSGVLGAVSSFTEFGIALLVLCYHRYKSRGAVMLLGIFLPLTVLFGFFGGTKSAVLRPLVMIVIVHIMVTRRLRAWWVVGFVVLMAVFYPISEVYRAYAWTRKLSAIEVIASPQTALRVIEQFGAATSVGEHMMFGLNATSQRLDGISILSVIMRDAGTRVPFQGGWTIAYIPMSFVPRLLWPGKPKFMVGQWVTDNFGGGPHVSSSTGATWVGEFYYNFGWPGVLIGMLTLGIWFRFLQESFLRVDATIPSVFAGVVTIVGLCTGIDGELIGATNAVVFNVTPIVILHLLVCFFTAPPKRLPLPLAA